MKLEITDELIVKIPEEWLQGFMRDWIKSVMHQPGVKEILLYLKPNKKELEPIIYALTVLNTYLKKTNSGEISAEEGLEIVKEIQSRGLDFARDEWNNVLTADPKYSHFVQAFTMMGIRYNPKKMKDKEQDRVWTILLAIFKLLRKNFSAIEIEML